MSNAMYVVSVREGAESYDSAVYYPPDEIAEADARELAASLANTKPGMTHYVVTAEEFAEGFDRAKSDGSSETPDGGN